MNIEETAQAIPESAWFKSSYSTGSGGECVEVAPGTAAVHVRDSKDTTRCALTASSSAWSAFVDFAVAHAS
ncbi:MULTISPECIES: DUF397 domain-containing protein [unclassified Streptomyces]|uniref:DUF397 domain-containing protein n=1 Tax=unclassified Streptomyces TaxID=2593676 RepID=UPI000995E163|nr:MULTISPECIES: DUF397 domain-containing protein [unclassified Streptomyces]MYT29004.1 DUF397 domain-containing protein [Streptomyces sp. SID8354]